MGIKKIASTLLICIFVLSLGLSLTACTRVSDDEAKEIIKDLVEKSYDYNVIYFGQGLKHDESSELDYIPVDSDAKFTTENELKEKTKELFSSEYSKSLISSAFVGSEGGIDSTASYPRYIQGIDGILTIRKNSSVLETPIATYDYSTIQIVKNSKEEIIARITTNNLGKNNQEVQIYFVFEQERWKIDSATY